MPELPNLPFFSIFRAVCLVIQANLTQFLGSLASLGISLAIVISPFFFIFKAACLVTGDYITIFYILESIGIF